MMLNVHHFSYGLLTPLLSYALSLTGCLLGLQCVARGRASSAHRWMWLGLAAAAIGGTGIWVMHFIAMLGFTIQGTPIRYNIALTVLSAVVAIAAVWIGLLLITRPRPPAMAIPIGGVITGSGVAAMHYLGMAAMNSAATIDYDTTLVVVSIVIAVAAATAALWFTLHRFTLHTVGRLATLVAAAIMAVAVSGMHYTGMAAMHAHSSAHHTTPHGADPVLLFLPLVAIVGAATMLLLGAVGLTPLDHSGRQPQPMNPEPNSAAGDDHAVARANTDRLRAAADTGIEHTPRRRV